MKEKLFIRSDIYRMANSMRLRLRHYARGFFSIVQNEPFSFPFNRLFFVLDNPDGDVNYLRDFERRRTFVPGNLYFIPACHPVEMHLNGRLLFVSVQFNLEVFPGIDLFSGCAGVYLWESPDFLPRLLEIFDTPEHASRMHPALELNKLIYNAAFALMGRFPEASFESIFRFQKYFPLIHDLEQSINARSRVADLARGRSTRRETFTRRFHAETGVTPKQLMLRILTAKALGLLLSGASIKEVASELEFSDEFVFSRFFKKQTGFSPSHYRRINCP